MTWTKEKIFLVFLFGILIASISVTLVLNDKKESSENYKVKNRKVLILYTGDVPEDEIQVKLDALKKSKNIAEYDVVQYEPKLKCIDITPVEWLRIAKDINDHYSEYDAFIVIHGLETICYTASALAFIFENLNKPIILTESNIVPSLILASRYKIPEVVICHKNKIYRGCRTTKVGDKLISSCVLGQVRRKGNVKLNNKKILNFPKDPYTPLKLNYRKKVVLVKLFPGIDGKFLAGLQPCHAVVVENYSLPTNRSFVKGLKDLLKRGIIVVNVSNKDNDELENIGIWTIKNMTTEAVITKLYILLSNLNRRDYGMIEELMKGSMRGEN